MPKPAAISDTTIARLHRAVGLLNVALALVCIATPAIRAHAGEGMAILLAAGLLAGAVLMTLVARRYDSRLTAHTPLHRFESRLSQLRALRASA